MKQSYNNESLAFLGHGKWKSALRHTLLIIGMVLMSMGAFAQSMTPVPDGLKMEKKYEPTNATGSKGNILVEVFVTGHSVSQHVPTDIVLVLDVSGSMDETLDSYSYTPRASQGYSYNNLNNVVMVYSREIKACVHTPNKQKNPKVDTKIKVKI